MKKISNDVYIFEYDDSKDLPNLGYVCGKKESIIIDVGCGPKTTKQFFDQLKELNLEEPKKLLLRIFIGVILLL